MDCIKFMIHFMDKLHFIITKEVIQVCKTLIIIPAYNEEKNIGKLIKMINKQKTNVDILVVNDSSKDNTVKVCLENGINVVDLPVNLGIGGAVQTGYKYAFYNNYDVAIQVDGDGQHNPVYIKQLVDKIEKGADMAMGSRFIEKEGFQSTFMRRVGIKYFTGLIKILTGYTITDPTSGFRACNSKLIKYFSQNYPQDYPEPETLLILAKNKYKIEEIPVVMNEREEGTSSITLFKSVYYMIKVTLAILIAAISGK